MSAVMVREVVKEFETGQLLSLELPASDKKSAFAVLLCVVHVGQDHGCPFQEQAARIGQEHAPAQAVEEPLLQVALQLLNLLAQGRLGDVALLRRPAETAGSRHRHEVAKVPQFHGPLRVCLLVMLRQET